MSSDSSGLRAVVHDHPFGLTAALLALLTGALVYAIAHQLFPYHSINHDEGVYLQQAAMLLDGRLFLTPGSEALRAAFRPWFFVESPSGLYPKYAPVPAGVFALGELMGDARLALAAVAVANVGLGYVLAAAAFDRRTGLVAAATFAAAPLFLINSATFLPYATTTALNLLFAAAYVRAVRRRSRPDAALAGIAIGLAFFARPYTAVLVALPYIVHALWLVTRAYPTDRATLTRVALTAGFGLLFVGVALAYNALMTGDALRFPFEAFAPRDGVGFGRRALLGYEVVYTPGLALRANAEVLWLLASGWFTAGLVGTAAAIVGVASAARGMSRAGFAGGDPLGDRRLQLLLVGVVVTVVLGNLAFWGNLNALGRLSVPNDGLITAVGPFYHFDLLLPLAAFAAHGTLRVTGAVRRLVATTRRGLNPRVATALLLVVALPAVGAAQADVLGDPWAHNREATARLGQAYAPFETTDLVNALVFLPATYGEWRNHPFQWLRNEPGFDGPTVYALARTPADDFAVIDAYPGRRLFRYRYHGVWSDDPGRAVIPLLEPVRTVEGEAVTATTRVAVPERIIDLRVAVSDGERTRRYDYRGELPATVAIDWTVGADGVRVNHPNLAAAPIGAAAGPRVDGPTELVLEITITEPGGGTLTYREAVLARPTDAGVQLLWPPASSVCTLVTECGFEGTYLPDRPDTRPTGIEIHTTLREGDP